MSRIVDIDAAKYFADARVYFWNKLANYKKRGGLK